MWSYQKQIWLQGFVQKSLICYLIMYPHVYIRLVMLHRIYHTNYSPAPIPVAARSKAYICGRSPPEIVGSNPTGGMDVSLLWCCVLLRRGLCDELITRPDGSYRLWFVVDCDRETSWMRRPGSTGGAVAPNKKKMYFDWLQRQSICLPTLSVLLLASVSFVCQLVYSSPTSWVM